jgi:hypothetical protein
MCNSLRIIGASFYLPRKLLHISRLRIWVGCVYN